MPIPDTQGNVHFCARFAIDRGPRELLIIAPELGWTVRKPAREDGGVVEASIDAETCPAT